MVQRAIKVRSEPAIALFCIESRDFGIGFGVEWVKPQCVAIYIDPFGSS